MPFRARKSASERPASAHVDASASDGSRDASASARKARKSGANGALLSFEEDAAADETSAFSRSAARERGIRGEKRSSRVVLAVPAPPRAREAEMETRRYDAEALRALASAQASARRSSERDEDAEEDWMPPPPPVREVDEVMDDGSGGDGGIPDAKTVAEAKAKREAARRALAGRTGGGGADYIDLGGAGGQGNRGREGRRERRGADVVMEDEDGDEFELAQLRRVFQNEPEMRRSAQSARETMKRTEGNVSIEQGGLEALESLKRALEVAESSSENARNEAKRADENTTKSQEALIFYEKELKSAGERYVYAQKLRDYFRDACAMLHDKKLIVEELEKHYKKFHAARSQALSAALNEEFEESAIEAEAAANAANTVFQRAGSHGEAREEATRAIQDAVLIAKDLMREKIDDMGRDMNIVARERAEWRSKRRQRDDFVSFVEDEREVALFHKDWAEARDAAAAMFRDASDEFSTLKAVKKHAEEWKRTHPSSYRSTFMSASVPHLFAPFVRLELIAWSPLFLTAGSQAPTALDSMSWYAELFDYGVIDGKIDQGDEDANLLPKIVEHVVLPIVSDAVERWWDPRDSTQSRLLACTLRDTLVYVDPSASEEAQEIVIAVKRRLKQCAESCTVPTYAPVVAMCAPQAARHASARFRLALEVIKSALEFHGVIERDVLNGIIFERIVNAHVVPYIRLQLVNPQTCAASLGAVVATLGDALTRSSLPAVAGLRDVARALAAASKAANIDEHTNQTIARVVATLGADR